MAKMPNMAEAVEVVLLMKPRQRVVAVPSMGLVEAQVVETIMVEDRVVERVAHGEDMLSGAVVVRQVLAVAQAAMVMPIHLVVATVEAVVLAVVRQVAQVARVDFLAAGEVVVLKAPKLGA